MWLCSQPPLLSQMVKLIWEASGDSSVLELAVPVLEREYHYWTHFPKAVPVAVNDSTTFAFSRYYADWTQPRPESYLCVPRHSLSTICQP